MGSVSHSLVTHGGQSAVPVGALTAVAKDIRTTAVAVYVVWENPRRCPLLLRVYHRCRRDSRCLRKNTKGVAITLWTHKTGQVRGNRRS